MRILLKSIIVFALIFDQTYVLNVQGIITTAGGNAGSSGITVSWTIGETIIVTAAGINNILTQGFNQGDLLITEIRKPEYPVIGFKLYPNPASENIKIITEGTENIRFRCIILDIYGKVLIDNFFEGPEFDISVVNLKKSIYILKIYQTDREITVLKIIKK